jgi:hypothetical protein
MFLRVIRYAIIRGGIDCRENGRMMSDLMWRLAARCAETDRSPDLIALDERSFDRNRISKLANWLERLGRDLKWFNEMLEVKRRIAGAVIILARARQRELARCDCSRLKRVD